MLLKVVERFFVFFVVVVVLRRVFIFSVCVLFMLMFVFFFVFDRVFSMLFGFRRCLLKLRISFILMFCCDLMLKFWCEYFLG